MIANGGLATTRRAAAAGAGRRRRRDDLDRIVGEPVAQPLGRDRGGARTAIDPGAPPDEGRGQRAIAGADVEHEVAGPRHRPRATSRSAHSGSSRWKPHRVAVAGSLRCRAGPGTAHHHRHRGHAGKCRRPVRASASEFRADWVPPSGPWPAERTPRNGRVSVVDDDGPRSGSGWGVATCRGARGPG